MKDLVMRLSALSGVSSWEDEMRDFLKAEAAPYAQEIRTDALGNLIVLKKGTKPMLVRNSMDYFVVDGDADGSRKPFIV